MLAETVSKRLLRKLPDNLRENTEDDIFQEARLALWQVAQQYDPGKCPDFEAFAAPLIFFRILDFARESDWLSRHYRNRVRKLHEVAQRLNRPPTIAETMEALGVAEAEAKQALRLLEVRFNDDLERPSGEDHDVPDPNTPTPLQVTIERELWDMLPVLDLAMVRMYFRDGLTLKSWGRLQGNTESRASQRLHRALKHVLAQFPNHADHTDEARVEDFKREVARIIERHTEALEAAG